MSSFTQNKHTYTLHESRYSLNKGMHDINNNKLGHTKAMYNEDSLLNNVHKQYTVLALTETQLHAHTNTCMRVLHASETTQKTNKKLYVNTRIHMNTICGRSTSTYVLVLCIEEQQL